MKDREVTNASTKKWFAFYTQSRHEKKIRDYLEKRGYEVFLPMQKVIRQWSDRKKKVEVPLFNSYIFVNETEQKIPLLLQVPGMAWSIRYNGRPAVLHQNELRIIERFLSSGLFVENAPEDQLAKGDTVEVIDGPLKGLRGTLIRTSDAEKFSVLLQSINQNMIVTLDSMVLRQIP